ncbi:hypothetical protein BC834DRAFT_468349 [Gloeopeniophorella convolvens]|nr:hypothetical protein BC834DRAFT_468349 [Gloeopeniophorella convolvens]
MSRKFLPMSSNIFPQPMFSGNVDSFDYFASTLSRASNLSNFVALTHNPVVDASSFVADAPGPIENDGNPYSFVPDSIEANIYEPRAVEYIHTGDCLQGTIGDEGQAPPSWYQTNIQVNGPPPMCASCAGGSVAPSQNHVHGHQTCITPTGALGDPFSLEDGSTIVYQQRGGIFPTATENTPGPPSFHAQESPAHVTEGSSALLVMPQQSPSDPQIVGDSSSSLGLARKRAHSSTHKSSRERTRRGRRRAKPVLNASFAFHPQSCCPFCPERFNRHQERERHQRSHFANYIYCREPDCSWTGYRKDAYLAHLRGVHSHTDMAREECCVIYDVDWLIDQFFKNNISLEGASDYAADRHGLYVTRRWIMPDFLLESLDIATCKVHNAFMLL